MASRSKFRIPSSTEMEKKPEGDRPKVPSLFSKHQMSVQSNKQQANSASAGSGAISSAISQNVPHATVSTAQEKITCVPKSTNPSGSVQDKPDQNISTASLIQAVSKDDEKSTSVPGQKKQSNSLLVSSRQKGNPILKHIRNVPFEYDDIVPDYQMSPSRCALFLSLRYHQLNPNYIHERLKQLGHSYELRVLLILVDIKDPGHCLKELAKMCILADCTLIVAFTAEEAGRYIETYKSYENKPPDLIMERCDGDFMTSFTESVTKVRRVNKTDAMTLIHAFGSVEKIVRASEEELSLCSGLGPQKAQRLHAVFHEPFLKAKRKSNINLKEISKSDSPEKKSNSEKK